MLEGLPRAGFARIAPPDGAFYIYADVTEMTDDSRELCDRILREAGVAVTPGLDFDPRRGAGTLRFSYAGSTEDIAEGLRRLEAWAARRRLTGAAGRRRFLKLSDRAAGVCWRCGHCAVRGRAMRPIKGEERYPDAASGSDRPARRARLALGAALVLAACAPTQTSSAAADTLYSRLGGQPAIEAVVGQFLTNVAADDRINGRFANADIPRLNRLLVEQICEATGGPCNYTGRDMRTTHTGMNITEAEFNALVEDLVAALDQFEVPEQEQSELLGALGGMKGDIVGV